MRGKAGSMRRTVGILMIFVMILTMIPQTAVAAFTQDTEGSDSRAADISVKWQPEKEGSQEDSVKVSIKAEFKSFDESVDSAEVKISLDKEEAQFLKQFRDEEGNLDENIVLETEKGSVVQIEEKEDGGVFLVFGMNKEESEFDAEIEFGNVSGSGTEPGEYEINLEENDISVILKDKNGEELKNKNAAPALEAESFSVIVKDQDRSSAGEDADEAVKKTDENISAKTKSSRAFGGEVPDNVVVNGYREAYSNTIFWVDNNNESSIRPSASDYAAEGSVTAPKLSFSVDGGKYKTLEDSDLAYLGMEKMPEAAVSVKGSGSYSVEIENGVLPSEVTHIDSYGDELGTYDIAWKVTPQDVDGYSLVDVNDENKDDYHTASETGWYYVLNTAVEFTVEYRIGKKDFDYDKFYEAFEKNFGLSVDLGSAGEREFMLNTIRDDIEVSMIGDHEYSGVINNAWKYNLDGTKIVYKVEYIGEDSKQRVEVDGFEEGDYLSILYDNTTVPNYGTNTDALYSGGTLYLTLSGTKDYEAEKVWLDDGTAETQANRPTGEFQLWRYRDGNSYSTAAPVRDSDGNIVSIELDTDKNEQKLSSSGFEGFEGGMLPKYDSEGYEYIYVLQEYLDGENASGDAAQDYEQVFGGVNGYKDVVEGKEGDEAKRESGNSYLYDGGVLLNRIEGTTTVSAVKEWKASAFQAAFGDVRIELTLQSRVKADNDSEDNEWTDTGVTRTMENFSAEISVDDISASMPKYNDHGRELEYRWIETAVYQGEDSAENLLKPGDADEGSATFTLQQDGRSVEYRSEVKIGEDGNTDIINSIENTVTYEVEKKWYDQDGDETKAPDGAEVAFNIYRIINGEDISADKSVAEFTMDGKVDDKETVVNKDLGITVREVEPWIAEVKPLAEFDEEGRQYEYILLETDGVNNYIPEYEITKDNEGNYYAEVINRPGDGNRIMVRKNWNDNSDIAHRQRVTITAYAKETDEKINSVTLGSVEDGGRNDVWYDWLGIGEYEPDEVYILETEIDGIEVPLQNYVLDSEQTPNYDTPEEPELDTGENEDYTTIQYKAENHKYEASYSIDKVDGVDFYTVENRRLGNVNMTVTKTWTDGDGEKREAIQEELDNIEEDGTEIALAMKLVFHETSADKSYTIHRNGLDKPDTVTVGRKDNQVHIHDNEGNRESSLQTVDLRKDSQTFYFWNLPKYDETSTIVRYDVEEVWVIKDGNSWEELSKENIEKNYPELYKLIADYHTTYTQTGYSTDDAHDKPDEQSISVNNYLSGTKTIKWNKSWHDEYNYSNGTRPDIYLDIYKKEHVKNEDGTIDTKTDVYISNYKWTYTENSDPSSNSSRQHYWQAEIYNVPEYDDLGYEITYYAMEKTAVDKSSFDYVDTNYSAPGSDIDDPQYIGNEYTMNITDGNEQTVNSCMEDVSEIESAGTSGGPHYALVEDGTFHNDIERPVTITGQKLWSHLPAGYPAVDLPSTTFTLYRQAYDETDEPEEKDAVATLTIKSGDWASFYSNGSYVFEFKYEGENIYNKGEDGIEMIAEDPENAKLLQKYDENGSMYKYTVKETAISDAEGNNISNIGEAAGSVFDVVQGSSNQPIENAYSSDKGELSVKKLLYLPMTEDEEKNAVPESYPAVTFELSRTYTTNSGEASESEIVAEKAWDSSEVKKAWENKTGIMSRIISFFTGDSAQKDNLVENTITFENLDIYAPNGSKYIYKVTEKTDYLGGYDTWVAEGDIEAENAENSMINDNIGTVTGTFTLGENGAVYSYDTEQQNEIKKIVEDNGGIAAIFINQRDDDQDTVTISGTKVWNDYNNVFGTRPGEIKLVLYRQADSQPEQNNAISKTEVSDTVYDVHWEGKDTGNQWTYTITGKDGTGELEKYAPNGMPWKYSVEEVLDEDSVYTTSGTSGIKAADANNNVELNNLTNTIMTSEPYKKTWVDEDGQKITEDYLGMDIAVGFKLQVSEKNTGDNEWYDAGGDTGYFRKNLDESDYAQIFGGRSFTAEIKGMINGSEWNSSRTFGNLPKFIVKKGSEEKTELDYRVVETYIKYGEYTQNVTVKDNGGSDTYTYEFGQGMFSSAYPSGKESYDSGDTNIYNMLKTTDFSVTKNWSGDSNNAYSTRGDTGRTGYDWEVSMVVQSSSDDGETWENVQIHNGESAEALTVTLYGTDEESTETANVSGLPAMTATGENYIYRAREINTADADGDGNKDVILSPGDKAYNSSYDVAYDDKGGNTIVTNILESTKVYAEKVWNEGVSPKALTFELKYQKADGTWASFETPAVVELNGNIDFADNASGLMQGERIGQSIGQNVGQSVLNGNKAYFEYDEWKAIWQGLPKVIPGSKTENGETVYTVVETSSEDYIQTTGEKSFTDTDGSQYLKIEIENNEKTSLSVEKNWYGIDTGDREEITVGLWRTAGEPEDGDSEQVKNDSGQQMTIVLSADTDWKGSFGDLPKYSEEGDQYFYYAREIKIGDDPAESREDIFVYNNDSRDEDSGECTTEISNIGRLDIAGTKTWNDNGNAYGTRPDEIELTLYRSTTDETTGAKSEETEVTEEIMREEGSYLEWSNTGEDVWTYTYNDLLKCDISGDAYSYRVEEDESSKYVVSEEETGEYDAGEGDKYVSSQTGTNIVNRLADKIDIPVEKIWRDNDNSSGSRPEKVTFVLYGNDEEVARYELTEKDAITGDENRWSYTFRDLDEYDNSGVRIEYRVEEENAPDGYDVYINDFTVENVMKGGLSVSKKVDGNAGDKDKEFGFKVELDDKTVNGVYGEMEFIDGTAEFTLKDGETITAEGLSADIGYEVYEKEANSDGYRTSSENATGRIPAGDAADVKFVNSKNIVPVDETDPGSRDAARTGDTMNLAVPVLLMTLSLTGIAAMLLKRRRRKQ